MNPVTPVNGFQYAGATPVPPKSDLDMQTFMRLLTVQLVNQNPLEPMTDRDFFAQMAQLGQVQGLDAVQKTLDLGQASNLIGKTVTAVRPFTDANSGGVASLITGKVVRVSMKNGKQVLGVQDSNGGTVDIEMGNIQEIDQ
ncbi:MAG TPA: flagellar hook capping FlgD N-terminal domain-containing protein [Fimbriimonadaceae bacterium]|nr:flagellar hook capping FlgD N-terminal domain-containing protein [Fimbriimonadaceae bacterium]